MSWEDVPQGVPYALSRDAAVVVRLAPYRGGTSRMTVSLMPAVIAAMGWAPDQRVTLRVGRGDMAGKVALFPDLHGRALVSSPRSVKRSVVLEVSDDLARWEASRQPADHEVVRMGKDGRALAITLPWDLSGDPPADADADGAASAAAA